jgi:predicted nuclease of restriction endonuclease-like RecB superfamily
MLTKAQRVYRWDRHTNSISSDRLEDECVPHLVRGIAVYRARIGDALGTVRNAARAALRGLRPDRVEAVIKLLDEAATYDWPRRERGAERRLRAFQAAAGQHPVLDRETGRRILTIVFDPLPEGHDELVALLYPDYPEFHRLTEFPGAYTAEDLRADYDLAQAQALLYDAARVEVAARSDLGHIVRYVRLSRLMHRIAREGGGPYRIVLDGPSSILRKTHAYGVDFAKFLAALVQARDWQLDAEIMVRKGWRRASFSLSSADGLRSSVPPPALFDSRLEARFAAKFGERRDGWRLRREAILLEAGEHLVVPDFAFVHEDGTEVALEIVGYWTPEYLAAKFQKLRRVREAGVIVAVRNSMALKVGPLPGEVLTFRSSILLRDLMPRLEAFRKIQQVRLGTRSPHDDRDGPRTWE